MKNKKIYNKKFSFIIPVYNINKVYLNKCIDSILNQTYKNIEIIVVDDGSEFKYANECDIISKKSNNIKVIHQQNKGVSVARNRGIEEALGEWIIFVDPDDWIDENMLDKLNPYLNENIDVLTFFYYDSFNNFEKVQLPEFKVPYIIKEYDYIKLIKGLINSNESFINGYFGAVWCNIYRQEFLNKNKLLFNSKLRKSQDTVFNLNLIIKKPKMIFVPISLYHYRHQKNSICYKYNKNAKIILGNLISEIKNFLNENNLFDECKECFNIRCINTVFESIDIYFFNKNYPYEWKRCKRDLDEFIKDNSLMQALTWGEKQSNSMKLRFKCFMILRFKLGMYIITKLKEFKNKKNIY